MTAPLVRIGDVVRRVESVDPRARPDHPFVYIDISSVDNHSKRIAAARPVIGKDAPSRARLQVRTDDVLVATTRPYLNAVAMVPPEFDGEICSTGFAVLRADESLDPRYLSLFVQSQAFIRPLAALVQGALYPAVSDRDVLSQRLPLPGRVEQRRIAAELTEQFAAIDRARKASSERQRAKDVLRGRIYADVFHGLIPLSVGRGTPAANDGWRWRLLTDLARLESGHTPSRNRPDWWGGGVPWIALPDIRAVDGQVITNTLETTNQEGIANSSARVLPPETVVMSRTASVGFVSRMGMPMATSQDFVNWVCGPELDPAFLMHLLIRARGYVRDLSSGAIHKTVYMPTVKAFNVCVPPIARQRRVAAELRERLAAIDAMTTATQDEFEAIEALPASLLRRAFEQVDDAA